MSSPRLSTSSQGIRPGVFAELQRRIDAHTANGGDLVPLQIGDTFVDPPTEARFEAACRPRDATPPSSGDAALYRYGSTAGLAELRAGIARFVSKRVGAVDAEREVLVGCGGTHAIFCAARTILDPGDEVLLAAPYWPLAPGVLATCGARVIEVPLTSRLYEDPSLDAGALFAAALTERTRAVYLITPNNPDGKVLSARHLGQIADLARAKDLWVIADEVYADHVFTDDGAREHVSIASLPGMRERTITAYSLSKSHALAGARVGYVIAPEVVVTAARRVSTHTVFNVPVVTQRIALAALDCGPEYVAGARASYLEARDVAVDALRGADVRFHVAEGGTYLFIDFGPVLGERPLEALLEAAIDRGVLLAPGKAFGAAYARYARLCYSAVPRARLLVGIERLREATQSL